jgi:hypothetical protein
MLAGLPPETAEALLIMRRAVHLGSHRWGDIDAFATAGEMGRGSVCFVFRPGIAEHALRRYGSVRDFSTGPGPLGPGPLGEARQSGEAP